MALANKVFALSATGVCQGELERAIRSSGGQISRIVHRRVDFLVVTPLAIEKNTQAVRKATSKFANEVTLVIPQFVHASIVHGSLVDAQFFSPHMTTAAAAAGDAAGGGTLPVTRDAARSQGATLAEVGLQAGDVIEVLVEMSDEPLLQWWPTRVQVPTGKANTCSIAYQPLPERDYIEETLSRARFRAGGTTAELYDLGEAIWRPWRREIPTFRGGGACESVDDGGGRKESSPCVGESGATLPRASGMRMRAAGWRKSRRVPRGSAAPVRARGARSGSRSRFVALAFKRMSAGRAFLASAHRKARQPPLRVRRVDRLDSRGAGGSGARAPPDIVKPEV
jgi:hypothetical protein